MRYKKTCAIIITFFTFTSILIGFGSLATNIPIDYRNKSIINEEIGDLSVAGNLEITTNVTDVFRLFETVNITINANFYSAANVTIQIPYLNNSVYYYNMTYIKEEIFFFLYNPGEDAPYGLQRIYFYAYNAGGTLLNAGVDEYIDICVLPNCLVSYNSTNYNKGSYLSAVMGPFNNSNLKFDWNTWNVSIVDSNYDTLFHINGDNINSFKFLINDSFTPLNDYFAKIYLFKDTQLKDVEYYKFEVKNNNPEIIEPTIQISPNPVFRSSTPNCQVSLNVSDFEDGLYPGNITVEMILTYSADVELEFTLGNNLDGSFDLDFNIGLNRPAGNYIVNLTVIDQHGGYDYYITSLTVRNNPPEIYNYNINGYPTTQGISILYGQILVFSFNVSDLEGIAYVKVALIDENNQWYNITQQYEVNVEITVRTTQLITGVWYIYVFVIDNDGSITGLDSDYNKAPQAITIIPDVLSAILPWIALIIGLIIGLVAGIGAGYYRIKTKLVESQGVPVKKKAATSKKPLPKKKPQAKPESIDDETKDKPKIYEKQELEKKPPQRKIKRKL